MNKRQLLTTFFIYIFLAVLAFATLPLSFAENTAVFGYPYYTTQAIGSGAKYDTHGSRFTLANNADITSINCLMDGGFNPTEPNDSYIYRFAIYTDNNGLVGTLIAQTETGTFIGKAGGSNDVWNTANFPQTAHLDSGVYWLLAVDNASGHIMFHDEYPAVNYTIVTSVIGGMDFPATLNSPIYSQDFVLCIYTSGTGGTSVPQPFTNPNNQKVSRLLVGCTADPTSTTTRIQITGNLSANYAAIPSAPILLSYADNPNATWHQITTTYTTKDGSFSTDWYPTSVGSYVINATYTGDSNHTAENSIVNIIVTAEVEKSQTVFSVDSNSTVLNLSFNSQINQLSFSVNGESGTTGYAQIYIAKSLLDDASKIQAAIDGKPLNFTFSPVGDAWILYFSYQHSSHDVVFTFNKQNTITPTPTNELSTPPNLPSISMLSLLVAVLLIVGIISIAAIVRYRKTVNHVTIFKLHQKTNTTQLKITIISSAINCFKQV